MTPQIGKTHRFQPRKRLNEGTNWSGGVVFTGAPWISVMAAWNVPAASQPTEAAGTEGGWNSSSWIGIDGDGTNDVLQAGIQQRVDASGTASYVAWFEWYCDLHKVILSDEQSELGPSIASLNGNIYLAWKGNDQLNIKSSGDGGHTFTNKYVSTETSPQPPCLTVHNNNLYVGWKGDGNDFLNVAVATITGNMVTDISNKVILPQTSIVRPALASVNGILYIAWKDNDLLNVMSSTDDGQTFGNRYTSNETSPLAPSLAAHNGQLFIAWKGDGNDFLNVARVTTAGSIITGFDNKVIFNETSPLAPALASNNGKLYIAWKDNDLLNMMYSDDDGVSFGHRYTSSETSPQPPTLAAHSDGHLYIAWKGDGNDFLNVSPVIVKGDSIVSFSSPAYIYQTNIDTMTISAGDTIFCSVQYANDSSAGFIFIADNTTGEQFSIALEPPPGATFNGNCVEWIMEVPDGGYPVASLPSFTDVNFTEALGCGSNPNAIADPENGMTLEINNGTTTLTSSTTGRDSVTIKFIG